MSHRPRVTKAIQAALHDIELLRKLVDATGPDKANEILTSYDKGLDLKAPPPAPSGGPPYLTEFWNSLQKGQVTMKAKELVEYYDNLKGPRVKKHRLPKEWTP